MLDNRYLYSSFVDAYSREVLARYFFESEFINIPGTEISLEVDPSHWVVYDPETENISLFSHEDFSGIYEASDKFAKNYINFVIDSINSDYRPGTDDISDIVLSVAEELVEKEISLTFKGKVRLIWDLIRNKKVYISKY
jgi:hypothetical protein